MPVYLCRWPNHDLSVVSAPNLEAAMWLLDEEDDPTDPEVQILVARNFMVHFKFESDVGKLGPSGTPFILESFGEATGVTINDVYSEFFDDEDGSLLPDALAEAQRKWDARCKEREGQLENAEPQVTQ
jgi:hypothetical protein